MQIQNFFKIISPWNDAVTKYHHRKGCIITETKVDSNGIHYLEFQEESWGLKLWKPGITLPSATYTPSKLWVFNIYNTYSDTVRYSTTLEERIVADLNTFIEYVLPVVSDVMERTKWESALRWAMKNITQYVVSDPFSEKDTLRDISFIIDIKNKFGTMLKETKEIADEAWEEYRRKNL